MIFQNHTDQFYGESFRPRVNIDHKRALGRQTLVRDRVRVVVCGIYLYVCVYDC